MAFKIVQNLTAQDSHPKPVKETPNGEVLVVSCKDFKGEISSITGIEGRFIYVTRLVDRLSGVEVARPTVRIVCTEECKTKCLHI